MVNIAVMGHGTVGSGVVEVLMKHREAIAGRAKNEINVKHILDLREFPESPYAEKFTKDFNVILNDPEVLVVVETMGGINPAYDFVKQCLLAGKNVVTSNKELVAAKGDELLQIANEKNVNFLFEASVGGGIPVLRPIAQCLAANDIFEIAGILNGTTNFILDKMIKDGETFEDALAEAQRLGYAEKDPTADVDGFDAARKICILASLGFGRHVYPDQVVPEGIRKISLEDIDAAAKFGYVIKLIGRTKLRSDNKITATVYPALVSRDNILSGVDGVFNAVMVRGDAIGDVMFYGRGAGKMPTASAAVADVIDCVKHLSARKYLFWEPGFDGYVADASEDTVRIMARAKVLEPGNAVSEINGLFGDAVTAFCEERGEISFITPFASEKTLFAQLDKLKSVEVLSSVRVFD